MVSYAARPLWNSDDPPATACKQLKFFNTFQVYKRKLTVQKLYNAGPGSIPRIWKYKCASVRFEPMRERLKWWRVSRPINEKIQQIQRWLKKGNKKVKKKDTKGSDQDKKNDNVEEKEAKHVLDQESKIQEKRRKEKENAN